ncbi:MAG: CPBP family intramembrane metalloprotease [Treponema sp.]|jgi:membrane protease YdiL (CAAX protease family)|nr:CPBP family intramembrane metalloprotease [Treponema sp.]
MKKLTGVLAAIDLDLWKRDSFRVKDAVLLCLFLIGVRFLSALPSYVFRVDFGILYDLVFLGIVLVMLWQSGREEMAGILKWRKVPAALFFSLLVMFFGLEIIRREAGNILVMLLPVPEGFFGASLRANAFQAFATLCFFPALNEELFFRGIILKRLGRNYPGRTALWVSSLLFALMHLNPWQGLLATVSGLFFGWIYMEFKTIWLCIFFHGYNNLLANFFSFPLRYLPNRRTYTVLAVHPLWLDVCGALLFVLGFVLTWGISPGRRPGTLPRSARKNSKDRL